MITKNMQSKARCFIIIYCFKTESIKMMMLYRNSLAGIPKYLGSKISMLLRNNILTAKKLAKNIKLYYH